MPRKAKPRMLECAANPCASCPYRRDTPSGVWHADEYRKLPQYDDPLSYPGVFLCHHSTTRDKDWVCRGWMEVHSDNIGVRLAIATRIHLHAKNHKPTSVPLYDSGAEACKAGMRDIKKPTPAAITLSGKLLRVDPKRGKR